MKKFLQKAVLLFVCCSLAFISLIGCGNGNGNNNANPPDSGQEQGKEDDNIKPEREIQAVSPANESNVTLANGDVAAFAEKYKVCGSAKFTDGTDKFVGKPVTLSWSCSKTAQLYKVSLSVASDLKDAVTYETAQMQVTLYDLFVNTNYFWQVEAQVGEQTIKSDIFEFTTDMTPRTLDIEGVSNTRDMGGYVTASGKKVKQGMVYRGARLENITEAGKTKALEVYGIRTDLDLRRGEEGAAVLGTGVNYIQISAPYYYTPSGTTGINVRENWEALAQIIKVFAVKENYPVYYHCSIGRDRTGTIGMLLGMLLGMSENDILMDYEMSLFSAAGCSDNTDINKLIDTYLWPTYTYVNGYTGKTVAEKCENFLLKIGVTADEIASIRSILLG